MQDILCMDTSGCKLPFPPSELQRSLDARTYNLWQRIVQADDIAAANIEGLEHCPSCDFAIIFEVGIDVTPLLTCLNEGCKLVSCRRCKKPVIIPVQEVPMDIF
jgi:TRIAD3 protein (E3 ubiquitin-protein ligase RNF216)